MNSPPPSRPLADTPCPVRLSRRAEGAVAYAPPRPAAAAIDLFLDANEGPGVGLDAACLGSVGPEALRRYPCTRSLERALAARLGVDSSRVLVTAGGDDAIDRACRACLEPGRDLVLPTPTFEMIERSARLAGARVVPVAWPTGKYPLRAVLGAIDRRTAVIAVVSPNNPTGAVASRTDLEVLSAAAPGALLLVDLAYTEFADEDLTGAALARPNALVVRTLSKAFGLAGLRVGYAAGPRRLIDAMRSVGSPYPVSGLSLAAAGAALERSRTTLRRTVARIREERVSLERTLRQLGGRPNPSQANFVLAEFSDARWVWRALASLGIGVRAFAPGKGPDRCLRITCPGDEAAFDRLDSGLRAALQPEALLFDMDGVLADVPRSHRRAVASTARPGLHACETPIPDRALLERLAARVSLGIVTGRPRADCERLLRRFRVADLFRTVVCAEDAPPKPDPASVRRALDLLGVRSAWLVGDTPDDLAAARAAGVVPVGAAVPGDDAGAALLESAGAALVLFSLAELEALLP